MAALHPDRMANSQSTGSAHFAQGAGVSPSMVVAVPARSQSQAQSDQIVMPRVGIQFPQRLSYEKWLDIGQQLAVVSASSAWCLGDWLIHGENAYSGRYRDAIKQTSLDYQTLRNYAWVARRFPFSRRRVNLSFGHHAEVAGLPEHEQDYWLRKAEELSWSRNSMRREVRASVAERSRQEDQGSQKDQKSREAKSLVTNDLAEERSMGGDLEVGEGAASPPEQLSGVVGRRIEIKLSLEQLRSCQEAAGRLGRSVEEWAVFALDRVAREELGWQAS